MARKTQRSFGAELRKEQELKEQEELENNGDIGPIAPDGVEAPVWRRMAAYVVDVAIGLLVMFLFTTFLNSQDQMHFLYLFSAMVTIFWLFVLFPIEYTPGQTIGRKLFHIYVRRVDTKSKLKWWQSFIREYFFAIIMAMLTVPLELIYIVIQTIQKPDEPKHPFQTFSLGGKQVMFARDFIFKTEAVYLPKVKKEKEAADDEDKKKSNK